MNKRRASSEATTDVPKKLKTDNRSSNNKISFYLSMGKKLFDETMNALLQRTAIYLTMEDL